MELEGLEVRISLASNVSFFAERVVKPTDNSYGQPLCDFAGQLILVKRCGPQPRSASIFEMHLRDDDEPGVGI
jgi:hypothetical protein